MNIVGVDEVGRGALIGNVVAAAVILPDDCQKLFSYQLRDSKKITPKKRDLLSLEIKKIAIDYAIGQATPEEIDEINIHHASLLAMKRAIEGLSVCIQSVRIDGKFCPDITMTCESFVGGDDLYTEISAASILAKTVRDEQLMKLDKCYPNYGFAAHKGYPTKYHKQAIEQYGVLKEHRKSYKIIKQHLNK